MSKLKDFPYCKPEVAQPDWDCGPVGRTRDSEDIEEHNFNFAADALDAIDPNGATWEVIRWRHWAVGWVEEIFTQPESPAWYLARTMCEALAESPYLGDYTPPEKKDA